MPLRKGKIDIVLYVCGSLKPNEDYLNMKYITML